MIEKLNSNSRTTEVNAVSMRMNGAFKNSGLTDPHLVILFTALSNQSLILTGAINRSKAESRKQTGN